MWWTINRTPRNLFNVNKFIFLKKIHNLKLYRETKQCIWVAGIRTQTKEKGKNVRGRKEKKGPGAEREKQMCKEQWPIVSITGRHVLCFVLFDSWARYIGSNHIRNHLSYHAITHKINRYFKTKINEGNKTEFLMTAKGREKVFMDKRSSSYRTKITGEFLLTHCSSFRVRDPWTAVVFLKNCCLSTNSYAR